MKITKYASHLYKTFKEIKLVQGIAAVWSLTQMLLHFYMFDLIFRCSFCGNAVKAHWEEAAGCLSVSLLQLQVLTGCLQGVAKQKVKTYCFFTNCLQIMMKPQTWFWTVSVFIENMKNI